MSTLMMSMAVSRAPAMVIAMGMVTATVTPVPARRGQGPLEDPHSTRTMLRRTRSARHCGPSCVIGQKRERPSGRHATPLASMRSSGTGQGQRLGIHPNRQASAGIGVVSGCLSRAVDSADSPWRSPLKVTWAADRITENLADAPAGFASQGNEFSAYMLIASNFILNKWVPGFGLL